MTLSYLLLPTIYDEKIILSEIKNQVYKKYNINLGMNNEVRYGLIPKPHFVVKNLSIILNKKKLELLKILNHIFILTNFFSSDKYYY